MSEVALYGKLQASQAAAINGSAPDWLADVRAAAMTRFETVGFPTLRDEEWKYTNVRAIKEAQFELPPAAGEGAALPEDLHVEGATQIVFVNGCYDAGLSQIQTQDGVWAGRLADAPAEVAALLTASNARYDVGEADAFTALNTAFLSPDAVLVQVAADIKAEAAVHVVYLTTGDVGDLAVFPRLVVEVADGADLTVVESHVGDTGAGHLTNAVTDLVVGARARLGYIQVQSQARSAYHVASTRVVQQADSRLDAFALQRGALLARHNLDIQLEGSGIESTLDGAFLLAAGQHVDNHTSVDHREPSSNSSQLYKGILDGDARGVFNGKIFVRQKAQQTNAYQLNRNLLLGEKAKVDTKPQLEIYADDVRCTHGAAVGQLDSEQVFYLQSRGVSRRDAVGVLARGFASEAFDSVSHAGARALLDRQLDAYFAEVLA